jgi:hypothetical protein
MTRKPSYYAPTTFQQGIQLTSRRPGAVSSWETDSAHQAVGP